MPAQPLPQNSFIMDHKINDIEQKRHQLIGYLANQLKINREFPNNLAFLEFENLLFRMGCDRWDLDTISSPLIEIGEIEATSEYGIEGLICTQKGESAWSYGKYKLIHEEINDKQVEREINRFKKWANDNWIGIVIVTNLISILLTNFFNA